MFPSAEKRKDGRVPVQDECICVHSYLSEDEFSDSILSINDELISICNSKKA